MISVRISGPSFEGPCPDFLGILALRCISFRGKSGDKETENIKLNAHLENRDAKYVGQSSASKPQSVALRKKREREKKKEAT